MNKHFVNWPDNFSLTDVLVQLIGGAWFVSYIDMDGVRQSVRKMNNKRKGFRRIDDVIVFLKYRQGIVVFNVEVRFIT